MKGFPPAYEAFGYDTSRQTAQVSARGCRDVRRGALWRDGRVPEHACEAGGRARRPDPVRGVSPRSLHPDHRLGLVALAQPRHAHALQFGARHVGHVDVEQRRAGRRIGAEALHQRLALGEGGLGPGREGGLGDCDRPTDLSGRRERNRRVDIEEAEVRMRLEATVEALRRDHSCEPQAAINAPMPELPDGVTPIAKVRELERELRLMGPINPLALQEFDDLQKRHTFLEEQLDDISGGKIDWRQVLREFWKAFSAAVGETKELRVKEVLDKLDEELGPHFFPANDNGGKSPRTCPSCADGRLGLKLGKFGAFIGCSNYPTCKFTRKLGIVDPEKDAQSGANLNEPKVLGVDAATGKEVTLRNGPYGLYIQLGVPEGKEKPKRASLLKGMTPDELTFEKAQAILALPRELGPHPDDKEPVLAGVGRFGPYVRHGAKYKSIPADESVLEIGMNRAVALLAEAKATGRGRAALKPIRIVGNHPADEAPIELYDGRYGMYVKHGGINATVPRDLKPEELTVDQALALLAERAAKGGGKKAKAPRSKKAAPVPANDAGDKPKAKKKAAAKKKTAKAKAEEETPPRTGTDG